MDLPPSACALTPVRVPSGRSDSRHDGAAWSSDDAKDHGPLPDGGRLLLVENVVVPGNEPSFGKWLDLLMLVYAGGRERTAEEFADLLTRSGFQMERVIPTTAGVCVVEALAA
jgi:hypothetical protein